MIEGVLGKIRVGDLYPVRIMAVINLSVESFYKNSVVGPDRLLSLAGKFQSEGAEIIDLGAVSTAPGSPQISEAVERERLIPALMLVLDNLDLEVSVDTQRSSVAGEALSLGASCINDVSGFKDPEMANTVADHGASAIIMASNGRPGDLTTLNQIIPFLAKRLEQAEETGVSREKLIADPGIGHWIPEKTPEYDLAILDGLRRLRCLGRPIMAALSRKSFIGAKLNQPDPSDRLPGSLAATAIAVYNGAHIVRTHDVSASLDVIKMAQAVRGLPPMTATAQAESQVKVEVLGYLGHECDLAQALRRAEVDVGGIGILSRKGSFRILEVKGISSMEALILKQEMLARGGDAAIPKMALRCSPGPCRVLIFGTAAQISGLVRKLERQSFNLPIIGKAIDTALKEMDSPERYR